MQNDLDPKGLLPCPFCGGEAEVVGHYGIAPYSVRCATPARCYMQGPSRSSKAEAISAWNRRASQSLRAPAGEADFYALHSPTRMHIGLWPKKADAEQAAKEYENCTITPLYASPPSEGVKVKALEWKRDHVSNEWHGNVAPGTGNNYLIKDDGRWCTGPNRRWVLDQIGDVDAAKAAAQSDYEQRIRSALEPAQSQEPK